MNIEGGSLGFDFCSRLIIGFFGNGCDPDVAFGVEEVGALSEDGSCLTEAPFGGASSTTLSNSALKSRPTSYSFFVGDAGTDGAVCAAM